VRLRALEGTSVVETDAEATRERYLAKLDAIAEEWSAKLTYHGGQFVRASTSDDPADIVRRAVSAVAGRFTPGVDET
jgi:L-lactate utilization protein LutB